MDLFSQYLPFVLLFIIGSAFGSFINVVIDRLPNRKSLLHPPSHCDFCRKRIAVYDLIPVVSYILLRGKCRYCKHRLPVRVFLVEAVSGLAALFLYLYFLPILAVTVFFVFIAVLAISLIDLDYGIIPDELLITIGIISVVFILFTNPGSFILHLTTGLASFIFFLTIFLITRGKGMGFGDVKYAFIIGLLSSPVGAISAFYIAFLTGAAISIILVVTGIKKLRGSSVPFGPFLSAGFILSLVFEQQISGILHLFLRF